MILCNLLLSSFSTPYSSPSFLAGSNPTSAAAPLSSPPPPSPPLRLICRCRRRDSSADPNAESVRGGRFRFRDEPGGSEVGGDFGQSRRRRWWSDRNSEDGLEEEFESYDDGDEDGEKLWDKIWIFKVFRSYGYLLPAIIASMLLATGPKAFLMALALPLGQSVISLAIDWLWRPGRKEPRRKPFSRSSPDFRKQEWDENVDDEHRRRVYQSWVSADVDLNDGMAGGSERHSFGGWDELDQRKGQARQPAPGSERSSHSSHVKLGKLSMERRYGDTPLFLRLLIAVFPFLGSWFRVL